VSWFFFAILSLFGFVAYDLLSRKLAVDSKDPRALSVVFNFLVTIMTPVLLIFGPVKIAPLSWPIVVLTVGSMIAWTLFSRTEYYAHKHVEASTFGIIEKLAPVLTLVFGVSFLGESMSVFKLVGIAFIVISNIYLIWTIGGKRFKIDKGIFFVLLVAIFLSLGWTLDKVVSPFYGLALFSAMSFGVGAIVNAITPPIPIKILKAELSRTGWKLALLALLNLVAYAALVKGLMLGEASRVTPIATGGTPLVVIFSAMLLGEKDHLWEKLAVAGITVVGIFLLS
jgi:uncharacterized membrane protein